MTFPAENSPQIQDLNRKNKFYAQKNSKGTNCPIPAIAGDGIGVEVTEVSLSLLKAVGEKSGVAFTVQNALLGGGCIDAHRVPVTEETIEKARKSDAVLLGAAGGPKWENINHHLKPERGLLELRKRLDAFANLRPAVVYSALANVSALKREVVQGVNIMVVRELTGRIYFGHPRGTEQTDEEEMGSLILGEL